MKKFIAIAALVGLSTAAFAQSQVDAFLAFQAPDLNAAKSNVIASGDQKTNRGINLETNLKYTYSLKLDDANTVKFGAAVDLFTPFYAGNANDPYKAQLAAKVIEPFVQYQGYGFDVLTSVAMYTFNPSDINKLSPKQTVTFYTGPFYGNKSMTDVPFSYSNYVKASYKYSVDKTLAFVGGVETDLAVSPAPFLLDVKPQASVIWTFLQLDTKLNATYSTTNVDDSSKTVTTYYVEPKLTVDLKDFVLPGLKFYTGGKLITGIVNGVSAGKMTGSRWDDGVSYTFTVKDVGTFGVDTYVRVGAIGPDNKSDDTQIDYNLKASYSIKF